MAADVAAAGDGSPGPDQERASHVAQQGAEGADAAAEPGSGNAAEETATDTRLDAEGDTASEAPSSAIVAGLPSAQVDTLPEVDEKANEGRDLHMLAMDSSLTSDDQARAKAAKDIMTFLAGGGKIDSQNAAKESCMHVACRFGTAALVKAFVLEKVPLKLEADDGWTALMYVARDAVRRVGAADALKMAAALLEGPAFEEPGGDATGRDDAKAEQRKLKMLKWKNEFAADADATNAHGTSALHLAAGFGSADMVRLLLSQGAKLTLNRKRWTPLHYAARFALTSGEDGADVVRALVAAGVSLEARTSEGATAAHLAAGYGSSDVLKALLECGADSHAVKEDIGWNALHYVSRIACMDPAAVPEAERKCKVLLTYAWSASAGAMLTQMRTKNRKLPLHHAVLHASPGIVGLLLGAHPEEVAGLPSIHLLAKFGQQEYGEAAGLDGELTEADKAMRMLIAANSDATWTEARDTGDYPLHVAAGYGTPAMVALLLEAGASEAGNYASWRPLHFAIYRARVDGREAQAAKIVQLLLDAAWRVGFTLNSGDHEFTLAVRFGTPEILRLLLAKDPSTAPVPDYDGNTALHHVAKLRQANADYDTSDSSMAGAAEMCEMLAKAGLDPTSKNAAGDTPLHLAAAHANAETLRILIDLCNANASAGVLDANGAPAQSAERAVNERNGDLQTVMHGLAKHSVRLCGDESTLLKARVVLAQRPVLRARDALGATPLHHAAAFSCGDLVTAIIDAEIHARGSADALCLEADLNGDTALHYVARHAVNAVGEDRAYYVCQALVSRCPPEGLRAINRAGETALHLACAFASRGIVNLLLTSGASPQAKNMQGLNPLHYVAAFAKGCVAASSKYYRDYRVDGICEELLLAFENSANAEPSSASGRTPTFPFLAEPAARAALRELFAAMQEEWAKAARPRGELGNRDVTASINALTAAAAHTGIMAALGGERRRLALGALRELARIWGNMSATVEVGQSYEDASIMRRLLYGPFSRALASLHTDDVEETGPDGLSSSARTERSIARSQARYVALLRHSLDALQSDVEQPYWNHRPPGLYVTADPHPGAADVFGRPPLNVFLAALEPGTAAEPPAAAEVGALTTIRYLKMPRSLEALSALCSACSEEARESAGDGPNSANASGAPAARARHGTAEEQLRAFFRDAQARGVMGNADAHDLREVLRELSQLWQIVLTRVQVGTAHEMELMAQLMEGPFRAFLDSQQRSGGSARGEDVLELLSATLAQIDDSSARPATLSQGMHARSCPGSGKGSGPRPLTLNVFDAMCSALVDVQSAEMPTAATTAKLLASAVRVIGVGVPAPKAMSNELSDVYKLKGALPLHGAVACGTSGTVRQLISAMKHRANLAGLRSFDPDVTITETGFTALHVLATCCNISMDSDEIADIVDSLVDAGAQVTAVTPAGESVMHLAAASCNAALVEALVRAQLRNYGVAKAAAAAQIVCGGGASLLHFMARRMLPRLEAAMAADAPAAAAAEAEGAQSNAALCAAVLAPVSISEERAARLAATAAAADSGGQEESSALSAEERLVEDCTSICRSLIGAGALVRARDAAADTALHVAVTCGNHVFITALSRAVKGKMQASLWSAMKSVALSKSMGVANVSDVIQGMIDGARKELYPQLVAAFEGAAALLPMLTALEGRGAGDASMLETVERIAAAGPSDDAETGIEELMQALTASCSVDGKSETQLAVALGAAIMLETKASKYSFTKQDASTGIKTSILEERDAEGRTPLHCVCLHGQDTTSAHAVTRVATALLAEGANANATTKSGYTPLYYAAAGGTVAVLESLLEGGADVNARVLGNWTPLHYCARYAVERQGGDGALALLTCLLERGADPNAMTSVPTARVANGSSAPWQEAATGKCALYLALAHGTPAMVAALIGAGADASRLNAQGWSAMHYAAKFGKHWQGEKGAESVIAALILAGVPIKDSVTFDVTRLDPVKKIFSSLVPGIANKFEDYKPEEMSLKSGTPGITRLLRKGDAAHSPQVLKQLMLLAGPAAVAALSGERKRTLFAATMKEVASDGETILASCL